MFLSDKTSFGALATNGCHPPVVFELFMFFIYLSVVCMMNVFLAVVLGAFGAQSNDRKGIVSNAGFDVRCYLCCCCLCARECARECRGRERSRSVLVAC